MSNTVLFVQYAIWKPLIVYDEAQPAFVSTPPGMTVLAWFGMDGSGSVPSSVQVSFWIIAPK